MDILWNDEVVYKFRPTYYSIHNIEVQVTAVEGINILNLRAEGKSDIHGATVDNIYLTSPVQCKRSFDCTHRKDWKCIKKICFEKCSRKKFIDPFSGDCVEMSKVRELIRKKQLWWDGDWNAMPLNLFDFWKYYYKLFHHYYSFLAIHLNITEFIEGYNWEKM